MRPVALRRTWRMSSSFSGGQDRYKWGVFTDLWRTRAGRASDQQR